MAAYKPVVYSCIYVCTGKKYEDRETLSIKCGIIIMSPKLNGATVA